MESVKTISEPFKKANRKFHPKDTVVDVGGVKVGGGNFNLVGYAVLLVVPVNADDPVLRVDGSVGETEGAVGVRGNENFLIPGGIGTRLDAAGNADGLQAGIWIHQKLNPEAAQGDGNGQITDFCDFHGCDITHIDLSFSGDSPLCFLSITQFFLRENGHFSESVTKMKKTDESARFLKDKSVFRPPAPPISGSPPELPPP